MDTRNCMDWIARDKAVIAPCQHLSYFPLVVERYEGAKLVDADGNEFIDFIAAACSMNLGGSHPAVTAAIKAQTEKNVQCVNLYCYNAPPVEMAERLASVYPGGVPVKVAFGNCGSDANEAAIKFARAYTGRSKILSFVNAYHGSTYGAASLTHCGASLRGKVGPFLPDVYGFPYWGEDVDGETCRRECLREMEQAFATWLPPDEVAAVILEPIQGDAGILPAHPFFLQKLYELCRKHGILFICEEVQQGLFRAGKWFSIEHYNIVPDGIILGKSLGGGLPLGAFIGRSEIMDTLPAPAHVFTHSGCALACAVGAAAFDVLASEDFQKQLTGNTALLWAQAEALRQRHPDLVQFIRGRGMSMGMGIGRRDADGAWQADGIATFKVLYRAYQLGLITISLAENVLRIQPPLIISAEELRRGFAILDRAMADYESGAVGDEVLEFKHGW